MRDISASESIDFNDGVKTGGACGNEIGSFESDISITGDWTESGGDACDNGGLAVGVGVLNSVGDSRSDLVDCDDRGNSLFSVGISNGRGKFIGTVDVSVHFQFSEFAVGVGEGRTVVSESDITESSSFDVRSVDVLSEMSRRKLVDGGPGDVVDGPFENASGEDSGVVDILLAGEELDFGDTDTNQAEIETNMAVGGGRGVIFVNGGIGKQHGVNCVGGVLVGELLLGLHFRGGFRELVKSLGGLGGESRESAFDLGGSGISHGAVETADGDSVLRFFRGEPGTG